MFPNGTLSSLKILLVGLDGFSAIDTSFILRTFVSERYFGVESIAVHDDRSWFEAANGW